MYVYDLVLFVILKDTLAVLSWAILCEDQGYSHDWASGQKTLCDNAENPMQHRTLCIDLSPMIIDRFSASTSLTSVTEDTETLRQVHRPCDVDVHSVQYWEDQFRDSKKLTADCKDTDPVHGPNCAISQIGWRTSHKIWRGVSASRSTPTVTSREPDSDHLRNTVSSTHFERDRNCEVCKRTKVTRAIC